MDLQSPHRNLLPSEEYILNSNPLVIADKIEVDAETK